MFGKTLTSCFLYHQRALFRLLAVGFFFCACPTTSAQDSRLDDGPIHQRKDVIGKLVRLQIKNNQIVLNQNWTLEKNKEDLMDEKVKELVDKGMDVATAERLVRRSIRTRTGSSPLVEIFRGITGTDHVYSSRSSNSARKMRIEYSTSKMKAALAKSSTDFSLILNEKAGAQRRLNVGQVEDSFSLQYMGKDFAIELTQTPGEVKLQFIDDLEKPPRQYTGTSFENLIQKHPDLITKQLLPTLEHIGIRPPLTSGNTLVKNAVRSRLVKMYSKSGSQFTRLVNMLDSDRFDQRESATQTLKENLGLWETNIRLELEKDLSPEVRYRLLAVQGAASDNDIDAVIASQKLLSSIEYLVDLLDVSDAATTNAIMQHLRKLTGFDANSIKQWQDYLKTK